MTKNEREENVTTKERENRMKIKTKLWIQKLSNWTCSCNSLYL